MEETGPATSLAQPQSDDLPSTTRVILLTACLTFANMLVTIGNSGVQVLMDEIAETLHISETHLQWIVISLQLPFVSPTVT
jgi:hypothetical protein